MSQFIPFAELRSSANTRTIVGQDFRVMFKELADRGEADVAIVSTEDGFSPLGGSSHFFEEDFTKTWPPVMLRRSAIFVMRSLRLHRSHLCFAAAVSSGLILRGFANLMPRDAKPAIGRFAWKRNPPSGLL